MHRQYSKTTIKLSSDVVDILVEQFVKKLKANRHPEIAIWNRIENILSGLATGKEYFAFNDTQDLLFSELIGVASGVYLLQRPDAELYEKRADFLKSINLL